MFHLSASLRNDMAINTEALRDFIEKYTGTRYYNGAHVGHTINVTTGVGMARYELLKAKLFLFGCEYGTSYHKKDLVVPDTGEQVLCLTDTIRGVPTEYKLFQLR